jgi:hypothetical protein
MPPVLKPQLKGASTNSTTRRAGAGGSESSPLLLKDDEATAQLRDRTTTSYTTIALVSALLSAVSFAAYATPPAELFASASTAPPVPPGMMPPPLTLKERLISPPPAPPSPHGFDGFYTHYIKDNPILSANDIDYALVVLMQILWHIYGIGASRARDGVAAGRARRAPALALGVQAHARHMRVQNPNTLVRKCRAALTVAHALASRCPLAHAYTLTNTSWPVCAQSCRWRSCATWRER